jgi:hypothetical protein
MKELCELRAYMLVVGIVACLMRIGLVVAEHVDFRSLVRCVENTWLDPASLSSSSWWSWLSS